MILTTFIDDLPVVESELPSISHVRRVMPSDFEAMGIPITGGRAFTHDDDGLRPGSL